MLQVVFACLDGTACTVASSDLLSYTGRFEPGPDFINPDGPPHKAEFFMGRATEAGFGGQDRCAGFHSPGSDINDPDKACGYILIRESVPILPKARLDIGVIYMEAKVQKDISSFVVYAS